MEITLEIEKIFATRLDEIRGIELTYLNGGTVTGIDPKDQTLPPSAFYSEKCTTKG